MHSFDNPHSMSLPVKQVDVFLRATLEQSRATEMSQLVKPFPAKSDSPNLIPGTTW